MELQKGDWVRTEKGEVGRIVLICRQSAFVEIQVDSRDPVVTSHLASGLTKIAPPDNTETE